MEENWEKKEFKDSWYGSYYYQVTSSDPWNYGLVDFDRNRMNEVAQVSINSQKQQLDFPWNQENAPVEIKMKLVLSLLGQYIMKWQGPSLSLSVAVPKEESKKSR